MASVSICQLGNGTAGKTEWTNEIDRPTLEERLQQRGTAKKEIRAGLAKARQGA